jgi:hypothetical protein
MTTHGHALRPVLAALLAAVLAAASAGCGETASTGSFTGESHAVAQAVADLQRNVVAHEQKKLCQDNLAAAVTAKLTRAGGSCQAALKNQLLQIDATGLTIKSIEVKGKTATARVKSTYAGKQRESALTLVKEGVRWKVAAAAS